MQQHGVDAPIAAEHVWQGVAAKLQHRESNMGVPSVHRGKWGQPEA